MKRKPPSQMACACGHTAADHDVKGSSRFPIYWQCRSCECRKFKSVLSQGAK